MTDYLEILDSTSLAQIVFGVLGLVAGSFFNVCILRIPTEQPLAFERSKCPKCGYLIPWYLNIPLVSYFLLRGRCQNCKKPISIQYPLVEGTTALLFIGLYQHFGLNARFAGAVVFASLLLIISVIDLYHQIIPDELSLPGIIVGFLFSFLVPEPTWLESLIGVLLGGGVFFAVAALYEKFTHREGLGGGDVKLLAMIGAWLGVKSIFPVIILSSAVGAAVGILLMLIKKKDFKTAIPFGPFLALSAMFYLLFGAEINMLFFPQL